MSKNSSRGSMQSEVALLQRDSTSMRRRKMRARRSKKQQITREEVVKAMNNFLSQGGKIEKLPEQRIIRRKLRIGLDKYDAYENWEEASYML